METMKTKSVTLTPRQRAVGQALLLDLQIKEIAGRLHISPSAVKAHMRALARKMRCSSSRVSIALSYARATLFS
jgi:DNA-binding NarL/FixJ family response regulator